MSNPQAIQFAITIFATCVLFNLVLTARIMLRRLATRIADGHGDDPLLYGRVRAQANFHEFVPLLAVLLAMLAFKGVGIHLLYGASLILLVLRLLHMLGMDRPSPNVLRTVGANGTWLLTALVAVWALAS
jgi:uncharacterized protein